MKGLLLLLLLTLILFSFTDARHTQGPFYRMDASPPKASLTAYEDVLLHPSPTQLSSYLKALTSAPRVFGTPGALENAQYIAQELEKNLAPMPNVSVTREAFEAWSNLPSEGGNYVSWSVGPGQPLMGNLSLDEPVVPEDPTSGLGFPLYNGYSGQSAGQGLRDVVYGNYCRQPDFLYLESIGISVKGRVVLCRYGAIFRGQKAFFAEQYGAISVLIYSDPLDDGYFQGAPYPAGPGRPRDGGQRGTLAYGWLCPGDPGAERLASGICGPVPTLTPTIPVQPIAWSQAEKLLSLLQGPYVQTELGWQGGLPFHYRIGPGPVQAELVLQFQYAMNKGHNVIARISAPDSGGRSVALGCHLDAWVMGASDPQSGIAILLETARLFGIMYTQGWRPKRDIIFAAWDGEEYGLLGSTHYVDVNAKLLGQEMMAYLNIDGMVATWFQHSTMLSLDASPLLSGIITRALAQTPSPNVPNTTCLQSNWDGRFGVLGSGSDYTAFLDNAGVSCASFGWGNRGVGSPQYHSKYDSFYLMSQIVDPGFIVHQASVTFTGLALFHLADDPVIGWNASATAVAIAQMRDSLQAQFPVSSQSGDWTAFGTALDSFTSNANSVQQHLDSLRADAALTPAQAHAYDDAMANVERAFLFPKGLPSRSYYKHLLQAPDMLNDYNSQVFPEIAYYCASPNVDEARLQEAIDRLTLAINGANERLDQVGGVLTLAPRTIAGIVVGSVLLCIIAGMIVVALVRRRRKSQGFTRL